MEDAIRQQVALRGKRLEYFTIGWNTLEGLVAVIAGAIAGSISLVGFGTEASLKSFPELRSSGEWPLTLMLRVVNVKNVSACELSEVVFSSSLRMSRLNPCPTSSRKTPLSTAFPESSWRAL